MTILGNTLFASSIAHYWKSAVVLSLPGPSRGALVLGGGGGDPKRGRNNQHHHGSTFDVVCRMTVQHALFEDGGGLLDSDGSPASWGEGKDRLACVSIINGKETDDEFVLDDYLSAEFYNHHGTAILGEDDMFVSMTGITVHDATNTLIGNEDTVMTVLTEPPLGQLQQRRLKNDKDSIGSFTLAILRVTTLDSEVVVSTKELEATVLANGGDAVSPINQFRDMSFGQFRLQPKGVFDVLINHNISDFASPHKMLGVINKAVKEQFGVDHPRNLADKVNFCIPRGSGPFIAYTSRGSFRAMYSDKWCASLGANIHEMGHQIALSHSHIVKPDGKDFSCYMSRGGSSPVKPIQAFNGPKHKKLGWFDNRTLAIDPRDNNKEGPMVVELAAFVDFDKTTEDQPVLLVIGEMYVLQYNRAKGFNIGTREVADMVTVTVDMGNAGSERKAALNVNDEPLYTVPNYHGRNLQILVCAEIAGDEQRPDVMMISVGLDEAVCPKPSDAPTSSLSLRPSHAPSHIPTSSRSSVPSLSPSRSPSADPTSVPSSSPSRTPTSSPTSSVPTPSPTGLRVETISKEAEATRSAGASVPRGIIASGPFVFMLGLFAWEMLLD